VTTKLSTCVAAISPRKEKSLETKSRSFASFGKEIREAPLNLCCCYLSYKRKKFGNKKQKLCKFLVRG
jgi:hypothetical protein